MYDIFIYMSHINQPNVGKHISYMDPIGFYFHPTHPLWLAGPFAAGPPGPMYVAGQMVGSVGGCIFRPLWVGCLGGAPIAMAL